MVKENLSVKTVTIICGLYPPYLICSEVNGIVSVCYPDDYKFSFHSILYNADHSYFYQK